MCDSARGDQTGLGYPRAGVTDGSERLSVGAGNETRSSARQQMLPIVGPSVLTEDDVFLNFHF